MLGVMRASSGRGGNQSIPRLGKLGTSHWRAPDARPQKGGDHEVGEILDGTSETPTQQFTLVSETARANFIREVKSRADPQSILRERTSPHWH